tara:strand:- start:1048 stop:1362 length:315 start_codon:yes stop_codon:yes gene_type:complete
MIVEMRTYNIKTARLNDFIKIYDEEIREVHTKILGNQIGFFYSEFGKLNQVIHLYGYDSYEDRSIRRKELSENLAFKNYVKKVADLIVSQDNQVLLPTDFSKIK